MDLPSAGFTLVVCSAPGVAYGAALRLDLWKLIPYQELEVPVFSMVMSIVFVSTSVDGVSPGVNGRGPPFLYIKDLLEVALSCGKQACP